MTCYPARTATVGECVVSDQAGLGVTELLSDPGGLGDSISIQPEPFTTHALARRWSIILAYDMDHTNCKVLVRFGGFQVWRQ